MAILKKPYEISIWRDKLETNTSPSYYKEIRIAVIGSDTMTSPNKAFSPVLTIKNNGEVTFTFSMAYKYFDPGAQAEVINPFIGYLIEERKVKLHYDGKWYDFLIKNHEEDSESNVWTYTCTDAFVNELSKVGYNIEFSTDLNNNQGTAKELAEKTLENTDWEVADADTLVQRVKEPMYRYKVVSGTFTALDTSRDESQEEPVNPVTINTNEEIYVFYSYIANKTTKFVQFMRESDKDNFKLDSNNVIIGTNYRILTDVTYTTDEQTGLISFDVKSAGANPVTLATVSPVTVGDDRPQYTSNQGFRLAYGQMTTYDPVMERTVNVYQIGDNINKQVYEFVDSTYTTSDVVMSYITNGSNFNVYENGSLQGWYNNTPSTLKEENTDNKISKLQDISLTTYPEVGVGVNLIQLTDLTRITGYLELKFDNPRATSTRYNTETSKTITRYENTYLNTGFEDNSSFIDHITKGEEYILRLAVATATEKHGDLTPIDLASSNGKIRAFVAKYNKVEETYGSQKTYVYEPLADDENVILDFTSNFEENNTLITGGHLNEEQLNEHGEVILPANSNYIIDDVVQEPSSECVYVTSDNTQWVWYDKEKKYILKSNAPWFTNYYRTVAVAAQPLSNTWLSDPTSKIGIFLYADNANLCGGKYVYVSDIQITKAIKYTKENGTEDYVSIGNVPTAAVTKTSNFYAKPEDGAQKTDVDIYYQLSDLASTLACNVDDIKPVYNEKSEKILSISEAQSNCFNILQTICETFECWLKLDVEHNSDGSITLDETTHKPSKKVYLCKYCGKDNFAGFKYGINLNSIQRTVNSDEIVTKLIVDNVQSDYVDSGVMSIRNASTNPSGEANILNFDYYVNKGLIADKDKCEEDCNIYYTDMKALNNAINEKESERALLETAFTKIDSKRNVYTELIDTAQDKYMEGLADFEEATGIPYNEYVEEYGKVEDIISVAPVDPSDIDITDIEIDTNDPTPEDTDSWSFENSEYGFYVNTESGKKGAYRANKYFARYIGEEDLESKYVTQLCIYKNGGWVTKWKKEVSENPFFPEGDANWSAAWANKDLVDHGASTVETAAQSMVLGNYGYGYYSKENYLAVQLVSSVVSSIEWYRLYHWDKEETEWVEIYGSTSIPAVGEEYYHEWDKAWDNKGKSRNGETTLNDGDLTNHESIIDIIGQLYVSLSTINNYSGLLTNINKEYKEYKEKLKGRPKYEFSVSYVQVQETPAVWETRLVLNDYIDNFKFEAYVAGAGSQDRQSYESSVSQKSFVATSNASPFDRVNITSLPEGYHLSNGESLPYEIEVTNGVKWYTLEPDQEVLGYEDIIKQLREQKDQREKEFFSIYSKFIKEGTWSSNDYIDAELYYRDALQVSQTSAFPKVEYSINVAEVSELEGLENYVFAAGEKSYIEDTEFFGWAAFYVNNIDNTSTYVKPDDFGALIPGTDEPKYTYGKTPAREEVIISQVEWHLDEPETNVVTVQNYKTQFEDLFQRISATVQQVQYNEATYAKTTSILDADGTINQNLLLASLNGIAGNLHSLTTDGSVTVDGNTIIIQNLTKPEKRVKIDNEGISFSSDAGLNWHQAITGDGIDIGAVFTGKLNTKEVTIGSDDNPSFRWDTYGISAYKSSGEGQPYDLSTFVRFDEYGLYGINNGIDFKAKSLQDIKDKAHFAVTWDGFFIKNSYEGGGRVEITSDNDFRVLKTVNNQEKEVIKIGALEWGNSTTPITGIAPTLYGIRITNDSGVETFKTGDDGNITITGTINANAGNIGGMVVNNDWLRMNYIVLEPGEGIYSTYPNIKGETPTNTAISACPFWISDEDGSATFNNVTVRGRIKTSVFEYEEIQAVGGAFMFRPSSSVTMVERDGNDLIFTVEKPLLFREGSWLKIGNYSSDDGDDTITPDELNGYGLTYIYPIPINGINGKKIRLTGAAEIIDDEVTTLDELAGGSLIDMGNEAGTSNYGIGINSSDGFINLPPRAISLFETVVHPNGDPKISYNYKGILGTLPNRRLNNIDAGPLYDAYMEGTQGIYTNNMYIGDQSQYIAFYRDEHGDAQLRLVAKSFEILPDDSDLPIDLGDSIVEEKIQYTLSTSKEQNTLEEEWSITPYEVEEGYYQWQRTYIKYAKGRIEYLPNANGYYMSDEAGQPGPPGPAGQDGEDAVNLIIDSSNGNTFKNNSVNSTLTVIIYKGTTIINNIVQLREAFGSTAYLQWYWKRMSDNTFHELSVDDPMLSNAGFTLTLTPDKVDIKVVFQCEVKTIDN